jgi:hypothetical protein
MRAHCEKKRQHTTARVIAAQSAQNFGGCMELRAILVSTALACMAGAACSEDSPETDHSPVTPIPTLDGGGTGGASPVGDSGAPPWPAADASTQDAGGAAMDASISVPTQDGAAPSGADASSADATTTDAGGADASGSDGATPSAGTCLKGEGDFTRAGPYRFKSKDVTIGSSGAFTIVYPDPLEAACPHPIVAWGNGTLITGGTAYAHFNEHAASWGIVSIASHNSNVGDGSFHKAAIDYLLAQNKESGGEFFGKLSERAGVSGHSQGGAGADRSATHPNVKAIVNVQGSFGTPPMSPAAFLCLTGTDDVATTGCPMAARAAQVPAMSASYSGADHVITTLLEGTGIDQYKRLYSAWFRCFLADDGKACALFKGGADCPVCKEPGWDEIFSNNF